MYESTLPDLLFAYPFFYGVRDLGDELLSGGKLRAYDFDRSFDDIFVLLGVIDSDAEVSGSLGDEGSIFDELGAGLGDKCAAFLEAACNVGSGINHGSDIRELIVLVSDFGGTLISAMWKIDLHFNGERVRSRELSELRRCLG